MLARGNMASAMHLGPEGWLHEVKHQEGSVGEDNARRDYLYWRRCMCVRLRADGDGDHRPSAPDQRQHDRAAEYCKWQLRGSEPVTLVPHGYYRDGNLLR